MKNITLENKVIELTTTIDGMNGTIQQMADKVTELLDIMSKMTDEELRECPNSAKEMYAYANKMQIKCVGCPTYGQFEHGYECKGDHRN